MDDRDRYVMLMTSLPRWERLFLAKRPPLSRLKLDRRLRALDAPDARLLDQVEALIGWGRKTMELTDADVIAHTEATLAQLDNATLSTVIHNRLEMRTVIAALRRRQRGEPAPAPDSAWGFGRRRRHIADHWTEPAFRLDNVYPWLREAARSMAENDTVGFERLILEAGHRDLQRQGAGHEFDIEAVVIYVLTWDIFDRWARAAAMAAETRFEQMTAEGLGAYGDLQFEGGI